MAQPYGFGQSQDQTLPGGPHSSHKHGKKEDKGPKGMFPRSFYAKDNWCVAACCGGAFMCMVSTFVSSWRVDSLGLTPLSENWDMKGFSSRSYGIIHVKGEWSQSWTNIAQTACDMRNFGVLKGGVSAAISGGKAAHAAINGNDYEHACGGSQKCESGFATSMHARCTAYQTMTRVSMVLLCATFLSVLLIIGGTLISTMSKRKKSGGMAFGMYAFAGVLLFLVNIVWALVSDNAFKNLGNTAWYPYPSLGAAYYMHLIGIISILIGDTVFGKMVLPEVWQFDAVEEKIAKKQEKLDRINAVKAAKEQQRGMMAAQQMTGGGAYGMAPAPMMPPAGGFGGPPPMGYGQQQQDPSIWAAQPQPMPNPVGPAPAPAAAPAGGFGLPPAPAPLGYGQSPAGQHDFGIAAGAPSSGPPPAGPAAPAGGFGAPPAAGPPPVGGSSPSPWAAGTTSSGATMPPPAGAPKSYNWPAFSQDDDFARMPGPPPSSV